MYCHEVREDDVFDLIKSKDRNDSHLFTDVPRAMMERVVNHLSSHKMIEDGYVLINLDEKEIKHIESMIENSLALFDSRKLEGVKTALNDMQIKLNELNALIDSKPSLSELLVNTKKDLMNSMNNLEAKMKIQNEDDNLTKFILMSSISEEYVYGKIITAISKQPELIEKYRFKDSNSKLQFFNQFMQMDGIAPKDYDNFNNIRFFQGLDLWILTRSRDMELMVCFTNFQNISHPMINRVINGLTSFNSKVLRTMVFTTGEGLLTRMISGDGKIEDPYEYREHSLGQNKKRESQLILSSQ